MNTRNVLSLSPGRRSGQHLMSSTPYLVAMTNDDPEDLRVEDGRAHCPADDCDWWVPSGMQYLFHEHDCDADDPRRDEIY